MLKGVLLPFAQLPDKNVQILIHRFLSGNVNTLSATRVLETLGSVLEDRLAAEPADPGAFRLGGVHD